MKIDKALLQIAINKGISTTEVRREIQAAIDKGLKDPDPKVREYWSKIPKKGEEHTVEEVIDFIAKEVIRKIQI